jgi:hypothetical protein
MTGRKSRDAQRESQPYLNSHCNRLSVLSAGLKYPQFRRLDRLLIESQFHDFGW